MQISPPKIVLVTGATDGIGKQTALELAGQGLHVIVHGRSLESCAAARAEIQSATWNHWVDVLPADLASQAQVRRMAAEFRRRYNHLDVLINNAGVILPTRQVSEDGLEMTFAVNHLAPFLLTNLLLAALKQSPAARIINVSSVLHRNCSLDWNNLQGEKDYNGSFAYSVSKLCNVLFTYALARRLQGTQITVNCLHPGAISTKLLHRMWGSGGGSLASGAQTPVYLAVSPQVEGVSGKYFDNRKAEKSGDLSYDPALQEKLWQVSEALLRPG